MANSNERVDCSHRVLPGDFRIRRHTYAPETGDDLLDDSDEREDVEDNRAWIGLWGGAGGSPAIRMPRLNPSNS